jgi:hypothetical protein
MRESIMQRLGAKTPLPACGRRAHHPLPQKIAKEKTMAKKSILTGMLAIALVFGMIVVGCGDGSTDGGGNGGNGLKAPEEMTTAERWYKWVDASSSVTLNYSVGSDDVCTITVGGTSSTAEEKWKATARYNYTGDKYWSYVYIFDAWTDGDDRIVNVQYYGGGGGDVAGPPWLSKSFTITSERKTYTCVGTSIPESGVSPLEFQCADKTGTFYVKIISVTRTGVLDTITIKSITPENGLTDGIVQQFTIEADYVLSTFEQGVIGCFFNTGDYDGMDVNSFRSDIGYSSSIWYDGGYYSGYSIPDVVGNAGDYIPVGNDRIVNKGSGSRTFTVKALTKNWGSEGEFRVYLSLYPKPDDSRLVGLANSTLRTLSFE